MHTEVRDPAFLGVVGEEVRVEQVATGFGFTEGPVWDKARSQLIWSDMHIRVFDVQPDGTISGSRVFGETTGQTSLYRARLETPGR